MTKYPEVLHLRDKSAHSVILSDLFRVCLVFPPLVSLYGLFPVLVSCDYEFIWFQVCVCDC